jgi:hypothetical protein
MTLLDPQIFIGAVVTNRNTTQCQPYSLQLIVRQTQKDRSITARFADNCARSMRERKEGATNPTNISRAIALLRLKSNGPAHEEMQSLRVKATAMISTKMQVAKSRTRIREIRTVHMKATVNAKQCSVAGIEKK